MHAAIHKIIWNNLFSTCWQKPVQLAFAEFFSKKELFSKSPKKETEKPSASLGSQVYDDNGHIWWQYDGMLGLFWCEDSKKTDSDSYSCPGGDPAMKIMAEEHPGKTERGGDKFTLQQKLTYPTLGKKNILFNVLVPWDSQVGNHKSAKGYRLKLNSWVW